MSSRAAHGAPDWDGIRLVAFDVDGTLYDQSGLRLRMLREMLFAAVRIRDVNFGSEEQVRAIAFKWMEKRPLRHLVRYRYPHLTQLFQGLRQHGKTIGILSDYPARAGASRT